MFGMLFIVVPFYSVETPQAKARVANISHLPSVIHFHLHLYFFLLQKNFKKGKCLLLLFYKPHFVLIVQEMVAIIHDYAISMFSCSYLNMSAQCSNRSLSFNDKFLVNLLILLVQS